MKTHILLVSHSSSLKGGAERSLLEIARKLKEKDYRVTVVTPAKGSLSRALSQHNIPNTSIYYSWSLIDNEQSAEYRQTKKLKDFLQLKNIQSLIRKEKPDVIITNSSVVPWFAYVAASEGIPHIWFMREQTKENRAQYYPNNQAANNFIKKFSDHVVANSLFIKEYYKEALGINDIVVVYPEVEQSVLHYSKPLEITEDEKLKILVLGTLSPSKNQMEVLEAISLLSKKTDTFHVTLMGAIGSKAYQQKLISYIKEHNLNDFVSIEDYKPNPYQTLQKHHVSIIPSIEEPFGRVTLESMLLQRLVVASDSGGNVEIIDNENNGYLYPLGDSKKLSSILFEITKPSARKTIREKSKNGYDHVFNKYLNISNIDTLTSLIDEVKKTHSTTLLSDWVTESILGTIPAYINSSVNKNKNLTSQLANLQAEKEILRVQHQQVVDELEQIKNSKMWRALSKIRSKLPRKKS